MTEAATPRKPSALRQVVPWLIAGGILAYLFQKVEFAEVWAEMKKARISWIVGAYLFYLVCYYAADILSFFRTYRRLGVEIAAAETARLRFASYLVQALNGALTEIMTVLYLFRVKKTPILRSTSAAGFIYFIETYTMFGFLAYCAFFLPAENRVDFVIPVLGLQVWTAFQALIVIAFAVLPLWLLFWRTGARDRFPRLAEAEVMVAFKTGTLMDYAEIFGYRLFNNLTSVIANIIMLRAMDIDAPAALLFAAVPVIVNTAYWPVSAGGYGGPQIAALFLLKGHASEAQVVAYSAIWSTLFLLSRGLTGAAFILPVYRAAFPTKEKA